MTPSPPPAWTRTADGADVVLTLPRSRPAETSGAFLVLWAVGLGLFLAVPAGPLAAFAPAGVFLVPWVGAYVFLSLLAAFGLWVAAARDQVRVGAGRLVYRRGVGPVWKRGFRLDLADARRFVVSQENSRTGAVGRGLWGDLSVLEVEDATGRRRRVGLWYRREVLLGVAAELAELCELPADPAVPAVVDDPDDRFYPTQPAGSLLRLTPQPGGFVVTVPPLGRRALDRYFWGCSVFGPLLLTLLVLIGVFTLRGVVKWEPAPPPAWVVVGVMIGGGSLAVLFLLLLGVLRLVTAYGRSEVRVSRAGLEVDEPGVFRPVRWSWAGERVADVVAEFDPKDQSRSLVVVGHDGTRESVLGHLPLEDLQWLAARVRESL